MLVKCICTNCAGHLEFEQENAGESIACPHCGFQTTLRLPGTEEADSELVALFRKRMWRARLIALAAVVLVVGGFGYALYRWGVPWVEGLIPSIESTTVALLVLVLFCFILPFAFLWLIFPLLVVGQLRKMNDVLEQIAEASASEEPEPEAAEEQEESPNGVEPADEPEE
jgi:DNA-directed RNA polymerase subunit RPC12/RpoP